MDNSPPLQPLSPPTHSPPTRTHLALPLPQWATGAAADWIVFSALLFVGASLIPIFKGVKNEAFGPFTPDAEKLNGEWVV